MVRRMPVEGGKEGMAMRTYIAIDLKSFYASVECADRNCDPLTTNLVVADASRTEKTICLAVSPSLKAYGISGRARLFEVVQRVKEINAERFRNAQKLGVLPKDPETGKYRFSSASFDAEALAAVPSLELSYIIAPPQMKLYEQISTKIFSIYMQHISPEDIHVYSIDEVFIDATRYLELNQMTAHQLAMTLIREVLFKTGITATAGIGTNMYLAKIAMDIVAKHVPADKDGVRIAELDERKYRELLWCHKPITDFWRVGSGIARRLENLGCSTMGDVARLSVKNEDQLYSALGINAELLIDHAWGWEPTDIAAVKSYRPENNSISSGQVLMEPYSVEKARIIVREMTELLVLDLVKKGLVTKQVTLTINYDRESLVKVYQGKTLKDSIYNVKTTGKKYTGVISLDYYGRPNPKHAHGTGNLPAYTSSTRKIMTTMLDLYDRIVDPDLLVRRVTIVAAGVISRKDIPPETQKGTVEGQFDLFCMMDTPEEKAEKETEKLADEKERRLQLTALKIQGKYGKNALLKGTNFQDGATTISRNEQIGGHRSGERGFTREKKVPRRPGSAEKREDEKNDEKSRD